MSQITFPLLLLWIALCTWQDLRYRRIANRLTYPALLLALVWLPIFHQSFTGAPVSASLSGLVLALVFALPGQFKEESFNALRAYQNEQGLVSGGLTYETLEQLGIEPPRP